MIGYEFEFLVREGENPLSKKAFLRFHEELKKRGWEPKYDPGTGGLVGSSKEGIFVTSDDGICIMEINTPPHETLQECHTQMDHLTRELQSIYQKMGCSMIGLGTFPGSFQLENTSCRDRCQLDQSCEKSYIQYFNAQRYPERHHGLLAIAAHQIWLDVHKNQVMKQWQTINRLTPLLMTIFANGPIFNNKILDVLEGRDLLWRDMLSGGEGSGRPSDEKYFGMQKHEPATLFEYFDFLLSMPFYYGLREGKGFKLKNPEITFHDYFSRLDHQTDALWFDGKPLTVTPELEDCWRLQQSSFPHVRLKYTLRPGVDLKEIWEAYEQRNERAFLDCFEKMFLECRVISAQKQNEISLAPALLVGLQTRMDEVAVLLQQKPYEYWYSLYFEVLKTGLQTNDVIDIIQKLYDIAIKGLQERGHGEELFLASLKDNIGMRKNPAQEDLEIWKDGGLEALYDFTDFSL